MMAKIKLLFLIVVLFISTSLIEAQPKVFYQSIIKNNINVRGSTVVVGQVSFNAPVAGKVVVRFDGTCFPSLGDRVVLAASNTTSWGPNDGNVGVEAVNSDLNHAEFSHTRVYDISAGTHTYYALANNYVETDGDGTAYIYGSLTAEYFPNVTNSAIVQYQGISKPSINVRGATVVVGQVDITAPTSGKVVVHFDGTCFPSLGDLVILAASNTTSWGVNDGNVGVEAVSSDINHAEFSHTRVYNVSAGTHTYYALANNYVETGGNGTASIYGSLTAEYFPNATNSAIVQYQGISKNNINVRGATVVVGQVNINAPKTGRVIVNFDGTCFPSIGDLVILAASNTTSWGVNDGNVGVEALNSDINHAEFSHTRVYDVSAGTHTYYALANNYVETGGDGTAYIYGSLTAKYFPDIPTAIDEIDLDQIPDKFNLSQNYPNPFNPSTTIQYSLPELGKVKLTIFNTLGEEIKTLVNEEKSAGNYEVEFNSENIPSGIYFYQLKAGDFIQTKKMILLK
jgi:hypothetical protein